MSVHFQFHDITDHGFHFFLTGTGYIQIIHASLVNEDATISHKHEIQTINIGFKIAGVHVAIPFSITSDD